MSRFSGNTIHSTVPTSVTNSANMEILILPVFVLMNLGRMKSCTVNVIRYCLTDNVTPLPSHRKMSRLFCHSKSL